MELWFEWMKCVISLRPACSRNRSFMWMIVCLIGMTIRSDYLGVSSIVRALGLKGYCYDRILDFMHGTSLNTELLTKLWVQLVLKIFPTLLIVNGRYVLLGDGLKTAKEGRKMPGVKSLHQESQNNTKPEYIMGHSCQAIGILAGALETFFSVPLTCRIHEGIKFSNRDNKTLIDKMLSLLKTLGLPFFYYFVLDAYYANRKVIGKLLEHNQHLVTRVKSNAVAHFQSEKPKGIKKRGRPKIYGKKVRLDSFFKDINQFQSAQSPVYGEKGVSLLYREIRMYWRAAGVLMLYILVIHPTRGRIILASTDLTAKPLDVITLYGLRYKIELAFKTAIHVIGTFVYHFWMKSMDKIKRGDGNQHLHRKSKQYRDAVERKMSAYHCHMQLGLIAQGLLQYLSCTFPQIVWNKFGSWLRTIRPGVPPSEQVTAIALRNSFPDFLSDSSRNGNFKKFLYERIDLTRIEGIRLTAYGGS